MIRDDFYRNGEETLTSGIVVSKWIPDLFTDGELKRDIADAYALGYISYDEAPQTLIDLHAISFSNNLTTINFSTIEENRAWGYCWQNATGSDTRFNGQAYGYEDDNSLFTLSSSTTNKVRFTNDIQYSQVIQVDNIDFQIETFCFLTSSIDSNGNAYNGSSYQGHMTTDYTMRRQEYLDFLNGDTTIDQVRYHTPADNTTNYTTLSYSDFNEQKGIAKQVIGDYTVYIIFNEVGHSLSGARYSYKNNQNQWTLGDANLTPFFISSVDSSVGFTPQKIMYMPLGWTSIGGQPRFTLQNSKENFGPTYTSGQNAHCIKQACTSWYGLSSVSLADFSKTSGMHYEMLRESAFIYFNAGDGNTFVFIPIVRPKDIYKIFTIINSVNTGITTQASLRNLDPPNYSYEQSVALFDENNTPLYKVEQGDTAQAADPAILQPWQMPGAHNYDNDFDTDDIPDYKPPGPGPSPVDTEDKFSGDNVDISKRRDFTVNGVQYYALNSRLVQDFCERLWSQPKSFYEAIQIAGRQQNSIFDFIESLRYYPVNWEFGGDAEVVHMGTGAVLLNSDGTTPVQYSNITNGVITGYNVGSWHLSDSDYHWRNNFLDYAPYTKISAYIPYFGTIELDPASIAAFGPISSAEIYLDVSMDISTGCMTAYLSTNGGCVLAQKTTKIAIDLYLSGNDATAQSAAILRSQFNTTKSVLGGVLSPISALGSGNAAGALAGLGSAYATIGSAYLENSLAKKQIPVEVQSQGGTASNIYRVQTPYLTVHRQKISNPENYGHTTGYLVDGTYTINKLTGFTICRNVDVSGIPKAIDKEKAEIKKILESGFYA